MKPQKQRAADVASGLMHLRLALKYLSDAGCSRRLLAKVRLAQSSAKGAKRNAVNRAHREEYR